VGIFVGGKLLVEGSLESLAHNLQQQKVSVPSLPLTMPRAIPNGLKKH
jgi:ABC-2 type transport system ATP-binding protein